jgi:nucleotide-binding universal stress UspA family protein
MAEANDGSRILVGIDGSDHAVTALRWAIDEAAHTERTVEAIYVWSIPALAYGAPGYMALPPDYMKTGADNELRKAKAAVDAGPVRVESTAVEGRAVAVLTRMASQPDVAMVAVGAKGYTGLTGLLLGSVSHGLTHNCPAPLVIVPAGWDPAAPGVAERPILVGLDGSTRSNTALRWAVIEASRRRVAIEAIRAEIELPGIPADAGWLEKEVVEQVERVDHSGVEVASRFVLGRPVEVLRHEAGGTQLVVVGTRRIGRAHEFVTGSVSHSLSGASPVPVAIVNDRRN